MGREIPSPPLAADVRNHFVVADIERPAADDWRPK
jgi:hypothetical protein